MNKSTSSKKKPACQNGKLCSFCGTLKTDELITGKLHKHGDILAHFFCLLLSSGLSQNGEEKEGILGFLPQDILKELRRGKKLRCAGCKKVGATIGCCNKSCRKAFHLPCSLEKNSLHLFYGSFMTYCHEHKPYLKPHGEKNSDISCCICLLPANSRDPYKVLRPSCCKNGFFHKQCIQRQAVTAGYFFKCPLCNNTDEFKKEMLDLGIYIPEQDAAWELEQNAFHDLYERHSICDAETCLCPKGRNYDRDDCPWEVVLCTFCGSEGSHIACGSISTVTRDWQCPNCTAILNKMKEKRLDKPVDVIVIETSDSDTSGSSPRLQLSSSSDESFLCETPENCQPPRLRTPPRLTRKRFAQLNEYKYNLSPNHEPALKDDICSFVRTSPRTTKNIYSRRQRVCSLRELMRRKKQKKMESKSSTSNFTSISISPEMVNYVYSSEKEKYPGSDHDENKPSTSCGITDENYSRPFTRAKLKNEKGQVKEMAQRYQNNMIKVEKLVSSSPTKDVKMTSILNYFPNQHDSNKRISPPSTSKVPRKKMKSYLSDGTSDIRNYFK